MTRQEFEDSLALDQPPQGSSPAIAALWWDHRGEWPRAHSLVDDKEDVSSMWVHAYLHRKEGVEWNDSYWYKRAGKSFSHLPLDDERSGILEALLG